MSITVHKIGKSLIVDPSQEEEDVTDARITVGSHDGIINSIQKGKDETLSIEEISKIFDLSEKVWKNLYKKIEKYL